MVSKKIVLIAIIFAAISTVLSKRTQNIESEWTQFKLKYQKTYKSIGEDAFRKSIWLKNKLFVEKFNKNQNKLSFQVEMNALADRSVKVSEGSFFNYKYRN